SKARDEFKVMRLLAGAGYPVPRVDLLAVDDSPLGRPLVIMERIDGQIMGRLLEEGAEARAEPLPRRRQRPPGQPRSGEGSAADFELLLKRFARLLARLHALDWRPLDPHPDQARAETAGRRWLDDTEALARQLNVQEFAPV